MTCLLAWLLFRAHSQAAQPPLATLGSATEGCVPFDTFPETFAPAAPQDTVRVTKLVVWSSDAVYWVQARTPVR